MDWKSSKVQWFIAVVYSSLFPIFGHMGGEIANIALYLNIPFLPIGWIGGTAFVSLFNTQSVYPIGLFLTILLQVLFVMMNLKYYFKQDKSNSRKLIQRIGLILVFFVVGIIVTYHA